MKDINLDVVAPRCAKCNEPVSLNKRDCLCTRAREKGTQMAKNVFDKRSKRGWRNAEAHLSEVELAALLTVAYEAGAKDKYRAQLSCTRSECPECNGAGGRNPHTCPNCGV